jgi:SH3 domain protein
MLFVRLFSLVLLVATFDVSAQTLSVTDELTITLRTGPSTQNAILRNLTSGAAVNVLEENAEGNYARVRVQGTEIEGWVLTQYLVANRSGRDLLTVAERNLATARNRVEELETQLAATTADLEQTRAALEGTESSNAEIGAELAEIREVSANAIALREQNESLRRRVNELQTQIDRATMENSELASRSRQNWFVVGAAVLFGGIVIGLVAPSLRRRRTSDW